MDAPDRDPATTTPNGATRAIVVATPDAAPGVVAALKASRRAPEPVGVVLVGDPHGARAVQGVRVLDGAHDLTRLVNDTAFDIALVPGVTPYASPLKLFEYMVLGKAILSIDSANIREVLTHGENAWLVSPDGFAEGLERLAADPALRARLGQAARARIAAGNFTWDRNAARIVAWYQDWRNTKT